MLLDVPLVLLLFVSFSNLISRNWSSRSLRAAYLSTDGVAELSVVEDFALPDIGRPVRNKQHMVLKDAK